MKREVINFRIQRPKRKNQFGYQDEFCPKAERIAQANRKRNKYRTLDQDYEDRFYR